jgi:DinB superfamily
MKRTMAVFATLVLFGLCGTAARAQAQKKAAEKATLASVLNQHLSIVEGEFVSAAEAMPEDRYSFAPTEGEFKGVRTFGEQVKHVAAANYMFYGMLLGEKQTGDENGPADVKTKEQIIKYLKDSFAMGHRAISTITPANATTPVIGKDGKPMKGPFGTRLGLAAIGCWHPMDHYGQMVEYLRDNGIIPPASRPQPPAAKK